MNCSKCLFLILLMLILLSITACSFKADLRNPWQSKIKDSPSHRG